jgi:hypothetical protein
MSYGGSSIPLPHLIHVDIACEATVQSYDHPMEAVAFSSMRLQLSLIHA